MNLLFDGWLALQQNAAAAAVLAACLIWGSIILLAGLRSAISAECDAADQVSLMLGGWIVPVLLLAAGVLAAGIVLRVRPSLPVAAALCVVSAGVGIAWIRRSPTGRPATSCAAASFLVALLMGLLVVRMAFIAHLTLPLYFDSAEHYRIVQVLIGEYAARSALERLLWPTANYYHLGFHIVLAAAAVISKVNLSQLILVAGQVVLATLPFPLFLLARRATGSFTAGILAVFLGALGWAMPAYALNWGKYPALFALPVTLFTVNVACLADHAHMQETARRSLMAAAILGACAATLIHTRSIVVLFMLATAWLAAGWWQDQPRPTRLSSAALTIGALIALIVIISANTVLQPVLDPYLGPGIWITCIIGLLSVPALLKFPRLVLWALLAVLLLLAGLFIPGPGFANSTILDRPFVEMMLFVPLSLLGAAGLAALPQLVGTRRGPVEAGTFILVVLAILFTGLGAQRFYPSGCCSLVEPDDLVALDWSQKNMPAAAQVLIASAEVSSAPAPYPPLVAASDAGIWIKPLTGRQTIPLPYGTDFRLPATLKMICARGANFVFVGSAIHSFDHSWLGSRPDWYQGIVLLPRARIYRIVGCSS